MNSDISYNVSMTATNNDAGTEYEVSSWSSCDECGWGVKNRTAICRDATGAIAADCGYQISLLTNCFEKQCQFYPLNWADNLKNDSLAVWKVGQTANLKWEGGVQDGYVVIRMYHLHGDLKSELYEMNSHLESLDPLVGTDFTGQVIYQGPNTHSFNWVVPATVMASRRYLLEIDATSDIYYKLGYPSAKIHISIQGPSAFEFRWITSAAYATAIKITIEDDYDRYVDVDLAGPHVAGVVQKLTLNVDLGEIRDIMTTSAIMESVLITSQVTGYVGAFGLENVTVAHPSCFTYHDCKQCGNSPHCGWCDSRQLCLPLATDLKTWSKVMDCIPDTSRPNGFWNVNGCIDYVSCLARDAGQKQALST